MAEAVARARGTQPEGATSEADASRKVREMFTQIAPRYDLLNHLLSVEMDRVWRARTANRLRLILRQPGAKVLDLCCGTGDLAFALARAGNAQIVGADFAHTMLIRANEKNSNGAQSRDGNVRLMFSEADALRLPFADESFDLVTTAFGFRNLANYAEGLREIGRVLKPGGKVAILEFTEPAPTMIGNLYRWYCGKLLPKIGGLLSGNPAAYAYLPKSVARFFRPAELQALMESCGYEAVDYALWTLGTVALHTGVKKAS